MAGSGRTTPPGRQGTESEAKVTYLNPSGDPATPQTDTDGRTRTVEEASFPNLAAGSFAPSTGSYDALNSGTSVSIPKNASLSVVAFGSNSKPVDVRTQPGNVYPLEAGEPLEVDLQDVADVEAQARSGGDKIKWVVEVNN